MSEKIAPAALRVERRSTNYLWYTIPALLLMGLLAVLIFNYHRNFSIQGIRDGIDEDS